MQLEGDVLFDFDKAEIKPEATQTLDKVGDVIAQFPRVRCSSKDTPIPRVHRTETSSFPNGARRR